MHPEFRGLLDTIEHREQRARMRAELERAERMERQQLRGYGLLFVAVAVVASIAGGAIALAAFEMGVSALEQRTEAR